MARPAGFEPATTGLEGRFPNYRKTQEIQGTYHRVNALFNDKYPSCKCLISHVRHPTNSADLTAVRERSCGRCECDGVVRASTLAAVSTSRAGFSSHEPILVSRPGRRRLFVDRKAASRHEPPIVLEVESGERYHAERAEWNGKTAFVRDHAHDAVPALWVETDAEVTLRGTPIPRPETATVGDRTGNEP